MGKTRANKTGQDKAYLHPKSRKAKHLSSFQAHNEKSKKAQDLKMARLQSKAAKMLFFKERMEEMFLEDGKRARIDRYCLRLFVGPNASFEVPPFGWIQ